MDRPPSADPATLKPGRFDAVLIATDHDAIDYAALTMLGCPIVYTSKVVVRRGVDASQVIKVRSKPLVPRSKKDRTLTPREKQQIKPIPALPKGNRQVALLTCSMATDLELFELLAATVDRHVSDDIPHRVVVPTADLAAFKRFETTRRTIIAQEDVLPVRLRKLPAFLKHLSAFKPAFRRPLYLTPGGGAVRGWILQQFLKIELSRNAAEDAIMHVDSDVGFFRAFRPEQAFKDSKIRFFRSHGNTRNPMHGAWVDSSCQLLGIPTPEEHASHYIENCVLWSSAVARAMVDRIETVHNAPLHKVIFGASTMSEYYIYGLFADHFPEGSALAPDDVSFCNSFWPDDENSTVDFDSLKERLHPRHSAIAIQSTQKLDTPTRARIYEQASSELASV